MKKVILFSLFLVFYSCISVGQEQEKEKEFKVSKTDKEWREQLTELEYYVLREAGTERAFSSPLNFNKEKGTYVCAACYLPLFHSEARFDSGTAWPSFFRAIEANVGTKRRKLGLLIRSFETNGLT